MGFVSPYALFGGRATPAVLSAIAFRLRPRRFVCALTNAHGSLHYRSKQASSQDRWFVTCAKCGHSRHYSEESRNNHPPDWYSVLAGAVVWTIPPSGPSSSRLVWYEGLVMAFDPREAAEAFARDGRLPQGARVLVAGFPTELFTVAMDCKLK